MSRMPTLSRRHFIGYAGASFAFAGPLAGGAVISPLRVVRSEC